MIGHDMEDTVQAVMAQIRKDLCELRAQNKQTTENLAELQASIARLTADHTTIGGTNWR